MIAKGGAVHPSKVDRKRLANLTDLPNVGESIADDLRALGYATPAALRGADPLALYHRLCELTGAIHDPCVLDTFMSITDFLEGSSPRPWWEFTASRKARLENRAAPTPPRRRGRTRSTTSITRTTDRVADARRRRTTKP